MPKLPAGAEAEGSAEEEAAESSFGTDAFEQTGGDRSGTPRKVSGNSTGSPTRALQWARSDPHIIGYRGSDALVSSWLSSQAVTPKTLVPNPKPKTQTLKP